VDGSRERFDWQAARSLPWRDARRVGGSASAIRPAGRGSLEQGARCTTALVSWHRSRHAAGCGCLLDGRHWRGVPSERGSVAVCTATGAAPSSPIPRSGRTTTPAASPESGAFLPRICSAASTSRIFSAGLASTSRGSVFDRFFRRERAGPARRADIEVEVEVPLERVASGGEEMVRFRRLVPCSACRGSGAKPGPTPRRCEACGGSAGDEPPPGAGAVPEYCHLPDVRGARPGGRAAVL